MLPWADARSQAACSSGGGNVAVCWLWVAWAFHWQRYATINWSASYFAACFAIEALLLIWLGVMRGRMHFDSFSSVTARIGGAVFVFALIEPLLGLLSGRSWRQLEVFGVAPDPTVSPRSTS